jgi:hypothetical protein
MKNLGKLHTISTDNATHRMSPMRSVNPSPEGGNSSFFDNDRGLLNQSELINLTALNI